MVPNEKKKEQDRTTSQAKLLHPQMHATSSSWEWSWRKSLVDMT